MAVKKEKTEGFWRKKISLGSLIIGGLAIIVSSSLVSFNQGQEIAHKQYLDKFQSQYGVYALEIPQDLSFAGEPMPTDYFDVRESIDIELLVNTYWHSRTLLMIKRANKYFPTIEKILKEEGVPDDFKYLAVAESGLENVTSPSGAKGFWQFLKDTGIENGLEINSEVDERYHLEKSTKAACKYLKHSYKYYKSWTMVAASYNMGKNGLNKQIKIQKDSVYYDLLLNEETARYVFRIVAYKEVISHPERYGFNYRPKDLYNMIDTKTIEVNTAIESWTDFAAEHNTNYKILKNLNPWLRTPKLSNTAKKTYEIKIPAHNSRIQKYQHSPLPIINYDSINR